MQRFEGMQGALRVRDFRWVWFGQLASELGDWAARLALAVLVYDRTQEAALAGLVAAASFVPWIGVGQVLASFGDRFPRRRVMIAADLVRAGVFASMALVDLPVGVLLLGALVAGMAAPPFAASRSALVADVVPEEAYPSALVLCQLVMQAAMVAGYLVGGVVVAAVGARAALGLNAITFLLSAAALLAVAPRPVRPGAASSAGACLRAALTAVRSDRLVLWSVALVVVACSGGAVAEALVAPYGRGAGFSATETGVLAAAIAVATIVGAVAVPSDADDTRLLRFAGGLCIVGAVVGIYGFSRPAQMPSAILPYVGIGIVFAVALPTNVVAGKRIPAPVRASAFGILVGVLMGAQAAAAALGGVLAGWLGPGVVQAAALVPVAAFGAWALSALPARARDRAATVAAPGHVPEVGPAV